MFKFIPDITYKWIQERVSEEEIFSFYLGIEVDLNKPFCSPLRIDKNPTCKFFITNAGNLHMKDFSGHFSGNCFALVQFMYSVSFKEALLIIANDFELLDYENEKAFKKVAITKLIQTKSVINYQTRKWDKQDLEYWNKFYISQELLQYYNVYPINLIWLNSKLHYTNSKNDPAYIYIFEEDKFKIYFPKRKNARFLCNTNVVQGLKQLPQTGKTLIITKALKDIMVLYNFNIPAIAPQSETQIIDVKLYEELSSRFETIHTLYDFDLTGIRTSNKMKKLYKIKPLFLTNGRFKTKNFGAKDPADYLALKGPVKMLEAIKTLLH
jgi:hypothetical protein